MGTPTFYEFFAGGGMCRAGLGADWQCLFANDFDPGKARSYRDNWGGDDFHFGDIHALKPGQIPGQADLAWASFPCQDLSLAGNGEGLRGARSGAFFGFRNLIEGLRGKQRAPKILVLENVAGALTSNEGRDFAELCRALKALGYVFGALTIDAAHFVPQSRPRLFIVALRDDLRVARGLVGAAPAPPWASAALLRAQSKLRGEVKNAWRWWALPSPAKSNARLIDLIEENPRDVQWHSREETARLAAMMSEVNREKLRAARASGERVVGALYRRTRVGADGRKVQRAEIRFDDVSGCLRTPGGGSSRQFIMLVEGRSVRSRLLSGREAARLMGLPDDYILPRRYNQACHLLGDGLAAPVVAHLSRHLLLRLVGAAAPVIPTKTARFATGQAAPARPREDARCARSALRG